MFSWGLGFGATQMYQHSGFSRRGIEVSGVISGAYEKLALRRYSP